MLQCNITSRFSVESCLDPVQARVAPPAANPPDNVLVSEQPTYAPHPPWRSLRTAPDLNIRALPHGNWFSSLRGDTLSGIIVALALIPEAIGFSVIAGVDPTVGLYASVV